MNSIITLSLRDFVFRAIIPNTSLSQNIAPVVFMQHRAPVVFMQHSTPVVFRQHKSFINIKSCSDKNIAEADTTIIYYIPTEYKEVIYFTV